LREATRDPEVPNTRFVCGGVGVCPAPKAKRRLFRKVRKIFLRSLHTRFSESRNPEGARSAKQRRAVPPGAGSAPKRVTEGEQGKYGRIGALGKHLSEGRLYKDADAATQQRNHNLPLAMLPAAKAESGWTTRSGASRRPPRPPCKRPQLGRQNRRQVAQLP
jgi:hypothetical protein